MNDHDDWILTSSGRQVFPMRLRPEDFHLNDIAHALAHQCRWGGHAREFYSVAEHSCKVYFGVLEVQTLMDTRDTEEACAIRLWALFHDAVEAYLTDVPRPLKRHPAMAAYREAERAGLRALAERLQLPIFDEHHIVPEQVREHDNLRLKWEARWLMPVPKRESVAAEWAYLREPPFPSESWRGAMSPSTARLYWLDLAVAELKIYAVWRGTEVRL